MIAGGLAFKAYNAIQSRSASDLSRRAFLRAGAGERNNVVMVQSFK
jgi:hypothetical protein